MHDLHNHADEKGFSGVHIMSIDPIYLRLSEGIESVVILGASPAQAIVS